MPDWATFLRVRRNLLGSKRFSPDRDREHRLLCGNQALDLIPFGGVEREDRSIAWPPDEAEVMNVSGFQEALATAEAVRLPGGLLLDVASLPALAVLKVWAWQERKYTARDKDASDLWLLLRRYTEAGNEERLYSSEVEVLTTSGFDLEKAGAWLLGRDAREVLAHGPEPARALEAIAAILEPQIDPEGTLQLIERMPVGDRERQLGLLTAFHAGLIGSGLPSNQ